MASSNPINLVQLTDTHLYGTTDGTLLKMNTLDSLGHVVRLVSQHESGIDLVLATGDIAQDASVKAYQKFLDSITPLQAPCRWIPGNHDIASVMETVAPESELCNKIIQIKNWFIVMLDTSIEGQVHGKLAKSEIEFLQASLEQAAEIESVDHCMICLHHNPVPGNAEWMKDIGLHNDGEFFDIATSCAKVRAIVYGHIHQSLDFEHLGIRCFCTPSTCIQFKPNVSNFALDDINPGYRNFRLFEDGTIESEVRRVTEFDFEVDFESVGY